MRTYRVSTRYRKYNARSECANLDGVAGTGREEDVFVVARNASVALLDVLGNVTTNHLDARTVAV